jgi:hypothetical protein
MGKASPFTPLSGHQELQVSRRDALDKHSQRGDLRPTYLVQNLNAERLANHDGVSDPMYTLTMRNSIYR